MYLPGRKLLRRSANAAALVFGVACVTACGTVLAADGEVPDPDNPAAVDIEATGGIAALRQRTHVDSASGQFSYTVSRLCPEGDTCPLLHSQEGIVSRDEVDALFRRVMQPEFRQLRKDYGTTRNAADMMGFVVTIHANGLTRSIAADDGTMPTILAQFIHDVSGAVLGQQ
jgi:hypothetical protein